MTKQPSPPEKKTTANPPQSDKAAEGDAPTASPMGRFRALAKRVVNASREEVETAEKAAKPDR